MTFDADAIYPYLLGCSHGGKIDPSLGRRARADHLRSPIPPIPTLARPLVQIRQVEAVVWDLVVRILDK